MDWHTEAIPHDGADAASAAVATLVKEPNETPATDRLEALTTAVESASMHPAKAATLRAILKNVRDSIDNALKLLEDPSAEPNGFPVPILSSLVETPAVGDRRETPLNPGDRVVEGVFDGQEMIGDDGKGYSVPPNYASKSKLIEGDMLKLTIGARGNFIYKQIGPIERSRLIGTLAYDQETSQYLVVAGGRSWKVLKASITYYKADAGDEAVILVPKNAPSKWAAVENIIKKGSQTFSNL